MKLKICITCGDEFDQSLIKRIGRNCRSCINQKRKDFYHSVEKNDPDRILKNRKRVREWTQNLSEEEKSELVERRKIHYQENREEILLKQKEYAKRNPNIISLRGRFYRERNVDKIRQYKKDNAEHYKQYMLKWREDNKDHIKNYDKEYKQSNKTSLSISRKLWHSQNSERVKVSGKLYRAKNQQRIKNNNLAWRKKNNHKRCAYQQKREAMKLHAMPAWLTSFEIQEMENIYLESSTLSKVTGILHHVDHIFPLLGNDSCGLHVPWNLRVITATENITKGNRIDLNLL